MEGEMTLRMYRKKVIWREIIAGIIVVVIATGYYWYINNMVIPGLKDRLAVKESQVLSLQGKIDSVKENNAVIPCSDISDAIAQSSVPQAAVVSSVVATYVDNGKDVKALREQVSVLREEKSSLGSQIKTLSGKLKVCEQTHVVKKKVVKKPAGKKKHNPVEVKKSDRSTSDSGQTAVCNHRHTYTINGMNPQSVIVREFARRPNSTCESDRKVFEEKFKYECLSKRLGSIEELLSCGRGILLDFEKN